MRRRITRLALAALAALLITTVMTFPSRANGEGATQIAGIGFLDFGEQCDLESVGADYAIVMVQGDLVGCHFVFVEGWQFTESGTYREWGTEMFVGWYHGAFGTFATDFFFSGKFEDGDLNSEIFGRCQHGIVAGSGTGVFNGVTGRLDMKDNVETGEVFYRGHLR